MWGKDLFRDSSRPQCYGGRVVSYFFNEWLAELKEVGCERKLNVFRAFARRARRPALRLRCRIEPWYFGGWTAFVLPWVIAFRE